MEFLTSKNYVNVSDVEGILGFAKTDTNVTETMIKNAIKSASDEVDLLTHTRYWSIEDSGTASDGTTTTLIDSSKTGDDAWTTNEWANYVVWIHTGTGNGQYARITSNDANTLTLTDTLTTAPDDTSQYRIIPDVYLSKSIDGTGENTLFLHPYPIKSLISLTIDDTSITTSEVYTYEKMGKLILDTSKKNPEEVTFCGDYPQAINITYVFGVYPIPEIVKRLVASVAALKCLTTQMGGTYNVLSTYSLPHFSGSVGQAYINIKGTLDSLHKIVNDLKTRVKKYYTVV